MNRLPAVQSHPRILFATTALFCAGLLGFAYYLQFGQGLEPCPMCIFQRLCYFGVLGTGVVGAIHGPRHGGRYVYAVLVIAVAAIGAGIAGRQVWLQHMPSDQVPECGPGLDYMLEMYPIADVIRKALRGTGECAAVDWTLLGLSVAEWSLLCFAGLIAAYVGFIWKCRSTPRGLRLFRDA